MVEVGGKLQVPCWSKEAEDNQLKVMVEAILSEKRVRQRQISGRRGGRNGDYPLQRHDERRWRGCRGRRGIPPPGRTSDSRKGGRGGTRLNT